MAASTEMKCAVLDKRDIPVCRIAKIPLRMKGRTSIRVFPVCALCETEHPRHSECPGCFASLHSEQVGSTPCAALRLSSQGKRRDQLRHAFCPFYCLTNTPQTDGTLFGHLLIFRLPFLPSVPLHAEPAIPGTPAGLLRFRNRRGCRGGYTGRCARFRVAEYRNC